MTAFHELQQTISRFVDKGRKRRQLKRELAQLAAIGDLDGVLADVGLVRSQVGPLLAAGPQSSEQLDQMLTRLGLDAGRLAPETRRDMTWTCLNCHDKRHCRRWMAGRDAADFHSFCPNAEELDRALSDQGVPPPSEGGTFEPYCPSADEVRRSETEARRREVRTFLQSSM